MSIDGPYDPKKVEDKIYKLWEDSGFFNPDNLPKRHKKPFSMVLPPPNVTGTLHIGHALTVTIEDIIIRYQRMLGKKALWIPGTDHASIATETKFLKETHIHRGDYIEKRQEFINLVNKFALKNQHTIIQQLRTMGASLDWSRLAFTLDETRKTAVRGAFKKMYDDKLLYIKEVQLVNWDTRGRTTISDDEVEYITRKTILYTFKYSKEFPIPIATTQLETKVGDVAVAVHPDGEYKKYIGQTHKVNFLDKKLVITIVGDEAVDPNYGTGAVGVTPAHSYIDFDIARRHNIISEEDDLNKLQVINEDEQMLPTAGKEIEWKKVADARKIILDWLRKNNLLIKEPEEIEQNVPTAQRSGGIIRILPKRHQFFININKKISGKNKTLKEMMIKVVKSGKIKIIPKRFEKTYFNWIENLRDWNISRQIWYGHSIPAEYQYNENGKIILNVYGNNPPLEEPWKQFPDTLDTWFSSGLWTFSTLGWPEETKDLKTYHPIDVLETGYDILFFWVARMILMSNFLLGKVPFHTVYLHGLVRDSQGRKMSKSLGNVIDPLVMTDKYGTDALRFALIFGAAPGTDLAISEDKIKGMKNFANKIWNASKFVLMNVKDYNPSARPKLSRAQKLCLKELQKLVKETTALMDDYKFYIAGEKVYHYFWHVFCDKIIEDSKRALAPEAGEKEKQATQYMILEILSTSLKLLHPFMPFITEEIYQQLPIKSKKLLMVESWPK